jgi:hypothetical protein
MKKIVGFVMVLAAACAWSQTPNIGLNLPVYSAPNWNVPLNQNFTILDNYLGGVNNFPNPLKASITGAAANLSGGSLGSVPYQSAANATLLLGPNTSSTQLFLCEQGTGSVGAAPTWCNGGGSVTSFAAPAGSWPSWLGPTVTNSTTTPSLAVTASAIPNSALANVATTVNGQTCTLGSTCTVTAAAGTLTGSTLASGVTGSSLTSVGTISAGTWQGTPIANSYLANNYTTVNGQVCTLGAGCVISTGTTTNLAGGSLGSIPYQVSPGSTSFLNPNTTAYTYYLCETGTGSVGAAPSWCAGPSVVGTVTSVGLSMPATQFTVTGSPVTTSGTLSVTLNSPTGTGAVVLANTPTLVTPNIGAAVATGIALASSGSNSTCWNTNGTTASCGSASLTVGTTTIASGTNGYVLYNNSGVLGNLATTGTGSVVLSGSAVLASATVAGTLAVGTIQVSSLIVGSSGYASSPQFIGTGTPSLTGCSLSGASGGVSIGSFASGTTGTCTVTITLPITTTGWVCNVHDLTTPANLIKQTASGTTSATISGTTVSADAIQYACMAY